MEMKKGFQLDLREYNMRDGFRECGYVNGNLFLITNYKSE